MPLKPKVPSDPPPAALRKPTTSLQHILETYATVLELRHEIAALHGRIDAIELAYIGLSCQVKELGGDLEPLPPTSRRALTATRS